MYKCILVATDGSSLSQQAVDHALNLADLTGAEVVAMTAVPQYPQTYFEGGVALVEAEVERIEAQWQKEAMDRVLVVQSAGQLRQVKVKPVTVKSDLIAEAIIDTAKRHHCDLIVMASHGRRGIQRLLLGSETQQVLTHSHIPVLVLR
ncbi:MAG: hypothetical protein RLZZ352_1274 [Pseudomonadota bacterium]|jgi:nucleotide-binding universal stress UspA family protein